MFFTRLKIVTLCTNIFFLLFGIYFLSLAQANALTVKHAYDEIPQGKAGCYSYHYPQSQLTRDRTQDPHDILFSDDGKTLFIVNKNQYGTTGNLGDYDQNISMNKVGTPFELKTVLTGMGSDSPYAIPSTSQSCEDVDAFDHRHSSFVAQGANIFGGILNSIHISQAGKIFFIMTSQGEILRYDLTKPNDFRTAKYVQEIDIATDTKTLGFFISKDGSRMFGLDSGSDDDTPVLTTYSLSPAFDLESATEIHSVDLSGPLGNSEAGLQSCRDVEFSRDGGEMFIIFMNSGDKFCNINVVNRLKKFKKKDADIIFGNTIINNDKFRYLVEGNKFRKNSVLMPFCHQSTITKNKILKKFLFNIKYNISADFDFFYRCLINNYNFKKYNNVIAEVGSGGLSDQNRQIVFNENINILKKYNKKKYIGKLYCFKFIEILKTVIKTVLPNFFINFILVNKYKKKVLK